MEPLGWLLIQSGWDPLKNPGNVWTQKETPGGYICTEKDHVKTQQEGSQPQAKERGLRRNQTH